MFKKARVLFLCLLVCLFLLPAGALAGSVAHNDLIGTLGTVKPSYALNEKIIFEASLLNPTGYPISNVRAELALPEGVTLLSGSNRAEFSMQAGETKYLEFEAIVRGGAPATGDVNGALFWVLIPVSGLAALLTLTKKKKTRFMLLMLITALVLSLGLSSVFAETTRQSFSVDEAFIAGGVTRTATLTFTYDHSAAVTPPETEQVTILLDDITNYSGNCELNYTAGSTSFTLVKPDGQGAYNNLVLHFHLSDNSVREVDISVSPYAYAASGDWRDSSLSGLPSWSGPMNAAMANTSIMGFYVWSSPNNVGAVQTITISVPGDPSVTPLVITGTVVAGEPTEQVSIVLDNIYNMDVESSTLRYVAGTNAFTLEKFSENGMVELNDLSVNFHLSDNSVRTVQVSVSPFAVAADGPWFNSSAAGWPSWSGPMNAAMASTGMMMSGYIWSSPREVGAVQTITISVPGDPSIVPLVITGTVVAGEPA